MYACNYGWMDGWTDVNYVVYACTHAYMFVCGVKLSCCMYILRTGHHALDACNVYFVYDVCDVLEVCNVL